MSISEELLARTRCADEQAFIARYALAGVVPGICFHCGTVHAVEPDQGWGSCRRCDEPSVISGLVLYGFLPRGVPSSEAIALGA